MKDNAKIRETEEKIKRAKEVQEKREREKEQRNAQKQVLVDMNTGKKLVATLIVDCNQRFMCHCFEIK